MLRTGFAQKEDQSPSEHCYKQAAENFLLPGATHNEAAQKNQARLKWAVWR